MRQKIAPSHMKWFYQMSARSVFSYSQGSLFHPSARHLAEHVTPSERRKIQAHPDGMNRQLFLERRSGDGPVGPVELIDHHREGQQSENAEAGPCRAGAQCDSLVTAWPRQP